MVKVSTLLGHVEADFSRRIAIRRRMFAHLGVDLNADRAEEFQDQNRETLLACARCAHSDPCERWLDAGCAGVPMFCKARAEFMELATVSRQDFGARTFGMH
jgi:hypothetical protein